MVPADSVWCDDALLRILNYLYFWIALWLCGLWIVVAQE